MAPSYKTSLKTVKVGGKSYKQPTITASSFTKAVKKVINREAETKSFLVGNNNSNLTDDVVYAWNLNAQLPQGDDSDDRIGNKIHIKNIYMKMHLYAYNSATLGRQDKHFRVMLIKTKTPLTNTFASITATDVFRSGTTTNGFLVGFPDRNKITVLMDKQITVPNKVSDVPTSRTLTVNHKINKSEFFESDASLYLKGGNYYFIVTAGSGDNLANSNTFIRFNYAINFKDI